MKMFTRLIIILSIIHAVVAIATEVATIKDEQKNWYQVDIIVFNYKDIPLDNITPRILPLDKKFNGNKIIPLASPDHPLTKLKNKTIVTKTNDNITNNSSSIDDNVVAEEEEATATVVTANKLITADNNHQALEEKKTKTEEILPNNEEFVKSEVSITSKFLEQVKLAIETTENISVIDNSIITENSNTPVEDNITYITLNKQPSDTHSAINPSEYPEKTTLNNTDEINNAEKTFAEVTPILIQNENSQAETLQHDIANQQANFVLNTTPFIELPSPKYLLQDKLNALITEDNIQLLSYSCFNVQIEDSSLVVLESKEFEDFKSFGGKIDFKRNNQKKIIVKTDFYLNMPIIELQKLKKQQNKVAEYSNKINKKVHNYVSYEAQRSIKNSGKLLYVDSPIIGLLIKITPINIEASNTDTK